MRFFTRLQVVSFPCAELLLVTGLFWAGICGNVMTDVMGTVLLRGKSLAQGWDTMERQFEVPGYPADPDANLSIFFNPVGEDRTGRPTENWPPVVEALRLPDNWLEGRPGDPEIGTTVADSSGHALPPLGEH